VQKNTICHKNYVCAKRLMVAKTDITLLSCGTLLQSG